MVDFEFSCTMGCISSTGVDVYSSQEYSPVHMSCEVFSLSHRQKNLLRSTWKIINREPNIVGKRVFLGIFDKAPEVKELFPFRSVWGDDLLGHPQFQAHASRFMLAVESAIANMDNLTNYGRVMTELGCMHASHYGVNNEYFSTFLEVMMTTWEQKLHEYMTSEVKDTWRSLFMFMMHNLQAGYRIAKRDRVYPTAL